MSSMESYELTKQPQDATECPYKKDADLLQLDSAKVALCF